MTTILICVHPEMRPAQGGIESDAEIAENSHLWIDTILVIGQYISTFLFMSIKIDYLSNTEKFS